jgi:hypothetical protein
MLLILIFQPKQLPKKLLKQPLMMQVQHQVMLKLLLKPLPPLTFCLKLLKLLLMKL